MWPLPLNPTRPDPAPERCRRFNLGDAMILIAAGAIGLAQARVAIEFMWRDLATIKVPRLDSWVAWQGFLFGANQLLVNATHFGTAILLTFLIWLILAVLIIRLRRPRPPARSLFRQLGFAACAWPVLAFAVGFPISLLPLPPVVMGIVAILVLAAAPTSWFLLIASRTWQGEPGWIDRLGRIVGAGLMVSSFALVILQKVFIR